MKIYEIEDFNNKNKTRFIIEDFFYEENDKIVNEYTDNGWFEKKGIIDCEYLGGYELMRDGTKYKKYKNLHGLFYEEELPITKNLVKFLQENNKKFLIKEIKKIYQNFHNDGGGWGKIDIIFKEDKEKLSKNNIRKFFKEKYNIKFNKKLKYKNEFVINIEGDKNNGDFITNELTLTIKDFDKYFKYLKDIKENLDTEKYSTAEYGNIENLLKNFNLSNEEFEEIYEFLIELLPNECHTITNIEIEYYDKNEICYEVKI